jgi:hypothetical protein
MDPLEYKVFKIYISRYCQLILRVHNQLQIIPHRQILAKLDQLLEMRETLLSILIKYLNNPHNLDSKTRKYLFSIVDLATTNQKIVMENKITYQKATRFIVC